MRQLSIIVAVIGIIFATVSQVSAGIIYMRSTVGAPWSESTNESAMDAAFGAGNWQDLRYETANPATTFSAANSFAFLEGGDSNANALEAFLAANLGVIEAWVNAGGSLFLNAAPNVGDGMSFGFGGVSLNYPNFEDTSVSAVDPTHPIFQGPFTPTSMSFTGTSFAHASLTGSFTALLKDPSGDVFLAERSFGLGHVIFGGMTTHNFHSPNIEAANLRANILAYGAAQANQTTAEAPEPASLAIWGLASLGLAYGPRRARQPRCTK